MIYGGNKTVVTSGNPVPLTSIRVPCCWVKIMAKADNHAVIYVVGNGAVDAFNANSTLTSAGGIEIIPGGIFHLGDSSAINYYDLQEIFIDAAQSGDGVKFLYGRR